MTQVSAPDDVGALWLRTLQRAMGRASHDVKDALNGVSVNLEVIRTRAERPNRPATDVAQFADAATNQLERLTALLDAVLALSRPERDPADVEVILKRIGVLCSASASASDAQVSVASGGGTQDSLTRVDGAAVRLALLAPLLDASTSLDRTQRAPEVSCVIAGDDDAVTVQVTADGRRISMPDAAAESLRASGVRWTDDGDGLSLTFPRA